MKKSTNKHTYPTNGVAAMAGIKLEFEFKDGENKTVNIELELCPAGLSYCLRRNRMLRVSGFCTEYEVMHSMNFPYQRKFNWRQMSECVFELVASGLPKREVVSVLLTDYNPDDLSDYEPITRAVDLESYFLMDWVGNGYLKWKCLVLSEIKRDDTVKSNL